MSNANSERKIVKVVDDHEMEVIPAKNEGWPIGCNQWWLLAGVALLIGGTGIVATTLIRANGYTHPEDYGVVIDAGSSHSQIFVYRWDGEKENGTAIARQIFSCKAKGGGISSYEQHPQLAGPSLQQCLNKAINVVPTSNHGKTPIFLGATAGMRLLSASNETAAIKVMESVRLTLNKTPFQFINETKQAQILSGADEGSFGWVTVNYLGGTLTGSVSQYLYDTLYGVSALPSYGALDMGGASTQITYVPENTTDIKEDYSENLVMYGRNYTVYTHSYLCYGANEAMRKLKAYLVESQSPNKEIENPCAPKGNVTTDTYSNIFEVPCTLNKTLSKTNKNETYQFSGTSNSKECHNAVQHLFSFSESCDVPGQCTFDGAYQPPVYGKYMAFSTYYFTMDFLNLTVDGDTFPLQTFRNKTAEFCAKSWEEISVIPVSNPDFLIKYCFDAHYIDTILTRGYKFDEKTWTDISFVSNVSGSDVGWTLGFMLNVSNRIPAEYPEPSVSTPLFVGLLALFAVFIGLSLGFACYAKNKGKESSKSYVRLGSSYGAI